MVTLNIKKQFNPKHIFLVKVKINDDGRYGQIKSIILYDNDIITHGSILDVDDHIIDNIV